MIGLLVTWLLVRFGVLSAMEVDASPRGRVVSRLESLNAWLGRHPKSPVHLCVAVLAFDITMTAILAYLHSWSALLMAPIAGLSVHQLIRAVQLSARDAS